MELIVDMIVICWSGKLVTLVTPSYQKVGQLVSWFAKLVDDIIENTEQYQ